MNLIEEVKQSLKWKKSNHYCATKLGISIEKYKQLKRQINNFKADIKEIKSFIK